MIAEEMLTFIAHNFYIQDCYAHYKKFRRWNILDEQTKNLYLYRAMDAINKWKLGEYNQEQVKLKPVIKENFDEELPVLDMDGYEPPIRLDSRMQSGSGNRFDEDLPF